jgi:hypothetical protein
MFTLPPSVAFFSSTRTLTPLLASRIAAARPPSPAPMMMTDLLKRLVVCSQFGILRDVRELVNDPLALVKQFIAEAAQTLQKK